VAVWGAAGLSGLQTSFPVLHLMKKAIAERVVLESLSTSTPASNPALPQDLSLDSGNTPMPEEDESAVALHGPESPLLVLPPSSGLSFMVPAPLAGHFTGPHRPPRA
jgi:hypothetical protein